MNAKQKIIHERALLAREIFHKFELDFIEILQDVERNRVHRAAGKPTLHVYAVEVLGFTDSVAYSFIAVARKAIEIPEMLKANLSVFVLSRLVSTIDRENAAELIHVARTKTSRQLDKELGRRNPRYKPEKIKILSEECIELTVKVSKDFLDKLKRAQALRAQKNVAAGIGSTIEASLDEYLRRHDPVQKAERAQKRKSVAKEIGATESEKTRSKFCAHRKSKRVPLTAAQRHAVFARDHGRCTQLDSEGQRCGSDQWIQIHHLTEVAQGGNNDPANLTTLCSFHHDLVHQLRFRFDERSTG